MDPINFLKQRIKQFKGVMLPVIENPDFATKLQLASDANHLRELEDELRILEQRLEKSEK